MFGAVAVQGSSFHPTCDLPMKLRTLVLSFALFTALSSHAGSALCPSTVPSLGGAVRGTEPLLPADNWWNLDVRAAPVDPNSAAYLAFINNGGTRRLHPDFGGEVSPGSVGIYGMPYAVIDAAQLRATVTFQYASESDGAGQAYYPIPTQSITQPHWVEGGAPASVDQRSTSDRHLLMVDCTNNALYELYNVWYDSAKGSWYAGSGAYFDLNSNQRRPTGWTSADAAGLAIFPGLVRYDEVNNDTVSDIGHAFRVTVRSTNGYVWPASHRAGSTAGALPMGARLRLKASVNGADPVLRSADPRMQKIFRAMQKHGLLVADNGSDLYVSGTFDTRWNNDVLNPAFALLSANDFEVIQLGWNPVGAVATLGGLSLAPASVVGGSGATGSVALSAPAPTGGATVALASNAAAVLVPSSVGIAAGATSATFAVSTSPVATNTNATLTATYAGISKSATLTVQAAAPPTLAKLALQPARVIGGQASTGSVALTAPAPAGGVVVGLASSNATLVAIPASVTVAAGASSASFHVGTATTRRNRSVTVSASAAGQTLQAVLTVTSR